MIKLKCYKLKSDRLTEYLCYYNVESIPIKNNVIKINNVIYYVRAIIADGINIAIIEKKNRLEFKVKAS